MVIIMDNIWKKNAKLLLIIVLDIFIISGATYAATTMYASNIVSYDNTTSGLDSDNVQGALDRLYVSANNYAAYETRLSTLESQIYPVGSIYISVSNTNPSTLFGGTWTAFGTGKTLVGVDTSQTEFNTVEKTGGEKNHTLTVNEMPSHTHSIFTDVLTNDVNANGGFGYYGFGNYNLTSFNNFQMINYTGGNEAHNNLQPYITVYMWKRTA